MAGNAKAAKSRFHLLTPKLEKALPAAVRRNAGAVGKWALRIPASKGTVVSTSGTVFLVHRSGDRAVFMTNHHVVEDAKGADLGTVTLADGSEGRVEAVMAKSRSLDYALVSVKLPPGSALDPVTSSALRLQPASR